MASKATRRNGQPVPLPPTTAASTATTTTTSSSSTTSTNLSSRPPYPSYLAIVPTALEASLLLIYPTTLLLGSLFSLLDPSARAAPYDARTQSHPAALAPSYFARKRNIFNVAFVKLGWFWTSLAFVAFLAAHPSAGPRWSPVLTPRRIRGLLRWAAVTAWWVVVTQWAWGPPLIDRGFRWTGGVCERGVGGNERSVMMTAEAMVEELVTAAACRVAGGTWAGGHDISGHVFLLVLGSGFLWLEILPVVLRYAGLREKRLIRRADGSVGNARTETQPLEDGNAESAEAKGVVRLVFGVAILSWWMLLMTAAYFHTWFEKLTGLLVALIGIATVYFLPRALPGMRAVLGMPGL